MFSDVSIILRAKFSCNWLAILILIKLIYRTQVILLLSCAMLIHILLIIPLIINTINGILQ
jgi:hypothetical protein